jgi:hypothetical protein
MVVLVATVANITTPITKSNRSRCSSTVRVVSRGVSGGVVIVVLEATAPTITTPTCNSSWSNCSSTVRVVISRCFR